MSKLAEANEQGDNTVPGSIPVYDNADHVINATGSSSRFKSGNILEGLFSRELGQLKWA